MTFHHFPENRTFTAMHRSTAVLALALLTVPAAHAADLSYTFVEANYAQIDTDAAPTVDGYGLRSSFAVTDNIHLLGDYLRRDDARVDLDTAGLGVGFRTAASDNVDLVATAKYSRFDGAVADRDAEGHGWVTTVGVRAAMSPKLEVEAAMVFDRIEDESDPGLLLAAQYRFNRWLGVAWSLRFSPDGSSIGVGPRVSF